MKSFKLSKWFFIVLLCGPVLVAGVLGQSADALIDKLVDKGILTVKEANDLREQADKNFNQAFSVKTGMPEWLKAISFYGDMRLREENFWSDSQYAVPSTAPAGTQPQDYVSRNRFRYRLRLGMVATLYDNFEVGLRLSSADPATGGTGGNPVSGNTTFSSNGSRKFIYLEQAYGKWYFLNGPQLSGSVIAGKMDNPFTTSEMIFDADYMPEGAAFQLAYQANDKNILKLIGSGWMLNEMSLSSDDPYLLGVQGRWDAAWTKKISTSMGGSAYWIQNDQNLTTASVPNQNFGNTRLANGTLVYSYRPLVGDASATYTMESFPMYKGAFPIKVGGEYMYNPAAPYHSDNYAWNAGINIGKAGKKGTWELVYSYRWLGANAQWEELCDDDFVGFYAATTPFPGPGASAGYAGGTNGKGHVVRLAYSPLDFLTLSAKCYIVDLIHPYPANADSHMNHLMVDATLKF
jgi:hypothetical protein